MIKYCCANCFGDNGLRKNIIPSLSPDFGDCSYCGTKGIEIIEPHALFDHFSSLINIYENHPDGKSLAVHLKEDWKLFSHPLLDEAHAKELLGDILDDGNVVRKTFVLSDTYKSESLALWDHLCQELMYENRYFLNKSLDTDRLGELLSFLALDEFSKSWYRARIYADDAAFSIDKMGAPPKRLVSHGRANPTGIPYLYLGSKPDTALSEIRPHTGDRACVAEFTLKDNLTLIDLRNPRETVSPFLLTDPGEMGKMLADIPFLERLGYELTRPVLPKSAALDYIPSQYICEFIKKTGFHGVLYSSSVSEGINLALFDPVNATGGDVSIYDIDKVEVSVSKKD